MVPPGSGLLGRQAVLPLRLGLQRGATGSPGLALAVVNALERWEKKKPEELEVMHKGVELFLLTLLWLVVALS